MATRFIDAVDSNGNVVSTFTETDDTVMAWSPDVIFPILPAGTYTFVQRTGKTTPPYVVEAPSSSPSITASDSLADRTLTITVDSLAGEPAPSTALTTFTVDGVDESANVTGTGPWSYTAPSSGAVQNIAWTVTATNSEGTDTASGSESIAADFTAPTLTATDSLTGRILTISTDTVTGVPAPAVSLTTLTLDGVDVLANATGTGPWSYDTPEAAVDQTVAWTLTATNSEGTDTASGTTVVTASAAPATLLLDDYPGAYRAYSLQQLRGAYTGPVVRARRSDDNAELDFTAAEVADGTLLSWTTTNSATSDARLVIWYDQSLNVVNSTTDAATKQPYLVIAGVQVTGVNGLPAVNTVAEAVGLAFDGSGMTVQDTCVLAVGKRDPALVSAGAPSDKEWVATFITDWERKQELFISFELDLVFGFQGLRSEFGNDIRLLPAGTTEGLFMIDVNSVNFPPEGNCFLNGAQLGGPNASLTEGAESRTDHRYLGSIGQYRAGQESSQGALVSEVVAYASSQLPNTAGINAEVTARYGITIS